MRLAFIIAIVVATFVVIFATKPLKAAMEPEEIMVRLATGITLKGTAYERRRSRNIRMTARHG